MSLERPSQRREPSDDDDEQRASEWQRMSQLAFEFLGYLLILGYAGWLLDQRYGWNGRGLFGGLMLGLATWIYRVLRVTRKLFK
ncbi:MAG: AtpZ/AtpI family protein [Phycisphaerae bacterium]